MSVAKPTIYLGAFEAQGLRPNMEDRSKRTTLTTPDKTYTAYAVFDGHGGQFTVEYLTTHLLTELETQLHHLSPVEALEATFSLIDGRLLKEDYIYNSGSTCVLGLYEDGTHNMWSAHVGDSRMMIKHQDTITATEDHTPVNEIERIQRTGCSLYGGTRIMCGYHILAVSRAFGDTHFKPEPGTAPEHVFPEYTCVVATPTITHHVVNEGDVAVLVTDGVTNVMSNEEIMMVALAHDDADTAAKIITELALSKGTRDNVCTMVVQWK